jgi:DNA-binding CsgD family transcriptional regulator
MVRHRHETLISGRSSPGLVNVFDTCLQGRAPYNSRGVRVKHDTACFRIDHDDYSPDELARDAYYQEFLRPLGLFWHANARLAAERGDKLTISFKRELRSGPYHPDDARILAQTLSKIRAAVRCARNLLDAEATGAVGLLHQRGDPVFEFDRRGRVRRIHGFDDRPGQPLRLAAGGRLVAAERNHAARLERAIAAATTAPQRAALVALPCSATGGSHFLQIVPLHGAARDFFFSTMAVGVLVPPLTRGARPADPDFTSHDILGLTTRELEVARLLTEGFPLVDIAAQMNVKPGTVRTHLKRLFLKTGTRRQAEVVALLARLTK